MNVYISIPINGRDLSEAKLHAEWLKATLMEHGHKAITPFDVCQEPDKSYAYYMGKDITALLDEDIDAVLFGHNFINSKGCQLEHYAAVLYDKIRVYEDSFLFLDFKTLTPQI